MFGKHRLSAIVYLLALAIFLLTITGEISNTSPRFRQGHEGNNVGTATEITAVRNERVLRETTEWETLLYKISSPNEGPTVMVIGGIHGNEPAGFKAVSEMTSWAVDRGTLLLLPRANEPAIAERTRSAPQDGLDLNRSFPGNANGVGTEVMASVIFSVIQEFEPDWVIDLHEASNFERKVPGSLGQTFIYPRGADSLDIVQELKTAVNRTIINEEHHFLILRGGTTGTLINALNASGYEALIVETVTKMPMEERIDFHHQVVSSLLYLLEITVY